MYEDVEAIRRDVLKKIHNATIPVPEYMSLCGESGNKKIFVRWEFLPFRLSGKVRDKTLLIIWAHMPPEMVELLLEEFLTNTPEAELAMLHLAFDVTEAAANIRQLLCEQGFTRYEIGDRVYYWSEVTGQLSLF